ncbi:MAG: hypothetical protein K0U93_07290 [Gammaproteobacteria bacterium]|nr:hypothetical protein [Gammaproteobacteria bacterium]
MIFNPNLEADLLATAVLDGFWDTPAPRNETPPPLAHPRADELGHLVEPSATGAKTPDQRAERPNA